jgi:hypothetical protein
MSQGRVGVGYADRFIALGREHQLKALAQGLVVVDDQNTA